MTRSETQVLSALLCDPAAAEIVAPSLLRGLGLVPTDREDFEASVAAGYVETDAEFGVRMGGRP